MKTITIMELKSGMILGEDVSHNGTIIFPAKTKLDSEKIHKLNRYPIICVSVLENIDLATTRYERMLYSSDFINFNKAYKVALNKYKFLFCEFFKNGKKINDDLLIDIYNSLERLLPNSSTLLDYLYNMVPNEDELTFTQGLNAALLCGSYANWNSMASEEKRTLILCGFYYDIGKNKIPYELLWKSGKLTSEEVAILKEHTVIGYDFVKDTELNEHVKNAILMHHEKLDGTGYPNGIKGEEIDIYARYIAIIDSYTAMASPRSYRSAKTPLEIIGIFESSYSKFDPNILLPFMKRIADFQIGTKVKLSDDTIWEIMIINSVKLSRPILRNENNELLNLNEKTNLEIVSVL